MLSIDQICAKFETSVNQLKPSFSEGLSPFEAKERLLTNGPNSISKKPKKHVFILFVECVLSLFNVMLLFAASMEFMLHFTHSMDDFSDIYIGSTLIGIAFFNASIDMYLIKRGAAIIESFSVSSNLFKLFIKTTF